MYKLSTREEREREGEKERRERDESPRVKSRAIAIGQSGVSSTAEAPNGERGE